MKTVSHVTPDSKLGRRLNRGKIRRSGRRYESGPKELERGVRSYMVASKTNGYPIVQTMSKRQYDEQVSYVIG